MKKYKGYKVEDREFSYGQVFTVLGVEVGCSACEDEVQTGHFACSTTPKKIRNDRNVSFHLVDNQWIAIYSGK